MTIFDSIVEICRSNPQILVFLSLAIGYYVGKIKFFGFTLGSTASVLLAALVLGQLNVEIPALLKVVAFALFTFTIGYKVGPEFFGALKEEGVKYILLSLVVAFAALVTTIILGKVLGFDPGTTAGMFAGSQTISASIGTAEGAISQLSISDAAKQVLDTNVAVAYAITYIFGTVGCVIFLKMVPRLWRIDLKGEAAKLEQQMSGGLGAPKAGLFSWSNQLVIRAYQVKSPAIAGKTASQLEAMCPERMAVEKIRRGDQVIDPKPDMAIQMDDIIVLIGSCRDHHKVPAIGPEIDPTSVTDIMGEVLEVCVFNPSAVGKTLGEIGKSKAAHGIFLRKITRQGHELPITRDTVVHKCDVLQLVGAKDDVERAAKLLGYPERPTEATDLILVGIGCVLGTLLGLIAVTVAGIPLSLGVGGGVLISGLLFGYLRAVHPTFGQFPGPAQWILNNLGINLFIACVGLVAGVSAVQAFQTTGLSVLLAGIVLSLVPLSVALVFGKSVLKMNPVLLFGGVAGARTLTAALTMLQEETDSMTPTLGYAAPYAFGNVLLTVWGSIIVILMSGIS